jgi:multidrug efflux system membrane fusion protein
MTIDRVRSGPRPGSALAVIVLVMAGAACHGGAADAPVAPPAVRVAQVATGTLSDWLRLSGRVVPPPDHDATLSPRVEGVLAEVTARVGERVARGQVLARVDRAATDDAFRSADSAIKSAAADADAKRRLASRTRTLSELGVVSGEQVEADEATAAAAEAALAQAQAALAIAARRRGWVELAAPFDGVVLRVLRQTGEPVDGTPATPVLELAAEHPVQVAVDATAAALARLNEGQDAEILLDAPDPTVIPARVTGVARAVDPATGTGPVRLDPAKEDASLLLGRIVEVRIAVARHDGVLVVPASALRGGTSGVVEVVTVVDHRAHVRPVIIGIRDGDRVELVSGVSAGDTVVVDDPVGLADDALVQDSP